MALRVLSKYRRKNTRTRKRRNSIKKRTYKRPIKMIGGRNSSADQSPVKKLVSSLAFRNICKNSTRETYNMSIVDKSSLEDNDMIFIHTADIQKFLNPPPVVGKRLTFIIHDSDITFDDNLMSLLEPYSINTYAANSSAKNAKQIPLGFRDNIYTPHSDLEDVMNDPSKTSEKSILCLVNFLVHKTVDERAKARDYFNDKVWAKKQDEYMNYSAEKATNFKNQETIQKRLDYYARLKQTKFTVCPIGTGIDTHRVYETLYFGGIPIIKTSFLDPMYERLGGCWIIKDWSEVTEEECNKRWDNKMTSPLNRNLLYNVKDWIV